MTFEELRKYALIFLPAVRLDEVISERTRHKMLTLWGLVVCLSIIYMIILQFLPQLPGIPVRIVYGVGFIASGIWLSFFLIESMYRSFFFRGMKLRLPEQTLSGNSITFEVARMVLGHSELLYGFLRDPLGNEILLRSGLSQSAINTLKDTPWSMKNIPVLPKGNLNIDGYTHILVQAYPQWVEQLFALGVRQEDIFGASRWVNHWRTRVKRHQRSWGREQLGTIQSIGKTWSYGQTYELEKYASSVEETAEYKEVQLDEPRGKEESAHLQEILSRSRSSNAIVLAHMPSLAHMVIARLAKEISSGVALSPIEDKHLWYLSVENIAHGKERGEDAEYALTHILVEAIRSGDNIVVIKDFVEGARAFALKKRDLLTILEPFLQSPLTKLILILPPSAYHNTLGHNPAIRNSFEVVEITTESREGVLLSLMDTSEIYRERTGIIIPFPVIVAIAEGVTKYLSESDPTQKALDILASTIPVALGSPNRTLTRDHVARYFEESIGIKTGSISDDERDMLLHLEERLHSRVVGQELAVQKVAQTIKRVRAGIQRSDKPLGSFLFFGPTGVGKTSVAKALAREFFHDESRMIRLDMSEFSQEDGLEKLLGSQSSKKDGILHQFLQQQPYGLLLLDEFEKSAKDVQDLFLQILDEGIFHDTEGHSVNVRNTIIIATSNAGADIIFKYIASGESIEEHEEAIIDEIVAQGSYRPELLNRFDAMVLFHPLEPKELETIATLMLEQLAKRVLSERGVALSFAPDVPWIVAKKGSDPKFGARPLDRFIQDRIESAIADHIIEHNTQTGGSIVITADMLA